MIGAEKLRQYQRRMAKIIVDQRSVILALDMGAGKTVTVLTAIRELLDTYRVKRVLIVAPINVAALTWPDEIRQWAHTRVLDFTLIRAEDTDDDLTQQREAMHRYLNRAAGVKADIADKIARSHMTEVKEEVRQNLARQDTEIHIINKEALVWLWELHGGEKFWPYDMLVVDEASMFKNGKMKTATKGLTRFAAANKAQKLAKRVVLMTGTPAPKGLMNLWGIAKIADGGERLGTAKTRFTQEYFSQGKTVWQIYPRPGSFERITDRLSDIMFSMDPKDYPEVPAVTLNPVRVRLPPKILDKYKRFEEDMYSEEYDVEAVNRGVLVSKLLQFANGSMYNEAGEAVWIHDEKLNALEDLIAEANGNPMLIAYTFKFDLERIRKRFKKAVVFGEGNIVRTKKAWNDGDIELLVAHPDQIGHGQNIQFGGHIATWYGLTHDLEQYQQFNKRLHRPGQTRPVFINNIIAEGTRDEKVLPLLTERADTQRDIIDAVRMDP